MASSTLRMKVKGLVILTNDEYVELATTTNKQLQLNISDVNLEVVDYQFASARDARGTNLTNEPKPKRPKNEILGTNHAAANRTAVTPITVPNIKKEPTHPNSQRTIFTKPRSPLRTFEWQGKPTNIRNHCIDTAAFLTTLSRQSSIQQKTQSNYIVRTQTILEQYWRHS
jgi:hypothetical protein